jgi:hypothetical protein
MEPDRFVWHWTADGQYSVHSTYRAYFVGWTSMAGAVGLWRAAAPLKVKYFFWIALHGRLRTGERRKRHDLQPDATCALSDQLDEATDHLLCSCVFAREVWTRLPLALHSSTMPPQQDSLLLSWWMSSRVALPQALRRSFDSLVLLVSWILWTERNHRTFDRKSRSTAELLQAIFGEADARSPRGSATSCGSRP